MTMALREMVGKMGLPFLRQHCESQEDFANWQEDSSSTCDGWSTTVRQPTNKGQARFRRQLDAIAKRRWKDIMAWVAFHPHEVATLRDAKNQSILHHACLFFAPAEVVDFILYAAPQLVDVPNEDGELALHWAVRLSTPLPILKLLLRTNPSTAFQQDHLGTTPIGLLWERHQSQCLRTWRNDSRKPKGKLQLHGWKRILMVYEASQQHSVQSSTNRDIGSLVDGKGEENCALVGQRRLRMPVNDARITNNVTAPRKEHPENMAGAPEFLPLHAAADRPCPAGLFPFFLEIYKDQARRRDSFGRLPLTIACQNPTANRSMDVATKIEQLLQVYPEAVVDVGIANPSNEKEHNAFPPSPLSSTSPPPHRHRYPLHDALAANVRWEDGLEDLVRCTQMHNKAHPCIFSILDPQSGLPPFALAAASANSVVPVYSKERGGRTVTTLASGEDGDDGIDGRKKGGLPQLNTVYRILRADPSLLQ